MARYRVVHKYPYYYGCIPIDIWVVQMLKSGMFISKWVDIKGFDTPEAANELYKTLNGQVMACLIDKDAAAAEIERRRNICKKVILDLRTKENKDYYQGKAEAYSEMLELLNTIEVKEVNLRKPYGGVKVQTSYTGNSLDGVIVKTTYKAQKG